MSSSQRGAWKRTSVANRRMVWLTGIVAFGTLCLAVAALFQYLTAQQQSRTAQELAGTAREQANVMREQANVSERSLNLAANTAANVSAQNEKAINAMQTQANSSMAQARTSEKSARAAEQSAQIARETNEIANSADVVINGCELTDITAGRDMTVRITLYNEGKLRAESGQIRVALVGRSKPLPIDYQPDTWATDTMPSLPYHVQHIYTHDFWAITDQAKVQGIAEGRMHLYVFGSLKYGDRLRKDRETPFCFRFGPKNTNQELCTWTGK